MNNSYYRTEIKNLKGNFPDSIVRKINKKVIDNFHNTEVLKEMYNEMMAEVYGDDGIKGY